MGSIVYSEVLQTWASLKYSSLKYDCGLYISWHRRQAVYWAIPHFTTHEEESKYIEIAIICFLRRTADTYSKLDSQRPGESVKRDWMGS